MEAHESTRKCIGKSQQTDHDDRIAGKKFNSLRHYNLVHKCILMPRAMNIPEAEAAVDKKWEKLQKLTAWQMTRVRKKEVSQETQKEGRTVHFATLVDICHLKKPRVGTEVSEIQRTFCPPE